MHKNFFQTSDFILYINLALSFTLEYFYPTRLPINHNIFFGLIILLIAWYTIYKSKKEFKKYKQKSGPNNDIREIINTGIYRYSRNPIYLAVLIINTALSLMINSFWILIDTFIIAWMLNHFLIKKEERFLLEKFDNKYIEYKKKARKFI